MGLRSIQKIFCLVFVVVATFSVAQRQLRAEESLMISSRPDLSEGRYNYNADIETSGSLKNYTDSKANDAVSSATVESKGIELPEAIGTLNVLDGAHVKFFTTLPGGEGKPKTTVRIATGEVSVYERYDWAEHHEELRGQSGHVWYRVDPQESHWIYGLSLFVFEPR